MKNYINNNLVFNNSNELSMLIIPITVKRITFYKNIDNYNESLNAYIEKIMLNVKPNIDYTEIINFEYDKGFNIEIINKIIFFDLNVNSNTYYCNHLTKIVDIFNNYNYKKVIFEMRDLNEKVISSYQNLNRKGLTNDCNF